ncbi:MAG: polysulfide reductase NrfD [Betaproteobacteria bacterium]|nr:polysulfide reductase NrfD [Betaproteobacteria bacterium]
MIGTLANAAPYVGYVYPNETDIPWSVLIVIYPYITGLVAGAFIVSSLYHVFGMSQFKPVARFALLTAVSFMFFVPMPLLFHLGNPQRAFNAVLTPHWTSAMSAFSYVAGFYVCLLLLEIWFAFRADIVALSKTKAGLPGRIYRLLSLGSDDVSPAALAIDHRFATALAIIGIPAAGGLHGYVGFLFGSVKAREWWSSDLMPIIFLLSAIVSGIGLLVVLYVAYSKKRKVPVSEQALMGLAKTLWAFLLVVLLIEGLELLEMFYKRLEGIDTVQRLIEGPIRYGMVLQWGCSVGVLGLLTVLIVSRARGRLLVSGMTVSGIAMMIGVLAMRWNVVIGGQELSKTTKGLLVYYPEILGHEGLLAVAFIFLCPFVVLWLITRFLSPWEAEAGKEVSP